MGDQVTGDDRASAVDQSAGPGLTPADLDVIARVFGVAPDEIDAVESLTQGMTNTNFVFRVGQREYVYRRPGVGTDALIDRHQEQRTYELVGPLGLADELHYFDGQSGVKITTYYADARLSDPESQTDLAQSMALLRRIHQAGVIAPHRFDIAERIDYYERLARQGGITLPDYPRVRVQADELLALRRAWAVPEVLCHVDFVYANILHLSDGQMRIIDWEYAGAADPLIDVAMYSIYAYYTRPQIDQALGLYLGRAPTRQETARVYLYVGLGGFLWSLWTQYKENLGDSFGDYAATMYRYLTDYYQVLRDDGWLMRPSAVTVPSEQEQPAGHDLGQVGLVD